MQTSQLSSVGPAPRPWRDGWSRFWLGDWTPIVRDPIDVVRLTFLAGAIVTAIEGDWLATLRLTLTFLATLAARALDLPRPFDLAFNLGMAVQAWGNVFHAFEDVYAYERHITAAPALRGQRHALSIALRAASQRTRWSSTVCVPSTRASTT